MNKKTKKSPLPEEALRFFRKSGSKGGRNRAKKHSKAQLSKWASLGGRPPKKKASTEAAAA